MISRENASAQANCGASGPLKHDSKLGFHFELQSRMRVQPSAVLGSTALLRMFHIVAQSCCLLVY